MKLNKFFMLGLAGLAFAACSNEDEVGNDLSQNSKTITVKIETGGYTTRASGDEAWTDGTNNNQSPITVNTVTLYLLDKDGAIVDTKILEISPVIHSMVLVEQLLRLLLLPIVNLQPVVHGLML